MLSTSLSKDKVIVLAPVMAKEIDDYKGRMKILIDGIDERGRRTISNSLKDTIDNPELQSNVISKIQSAFAMKYQRASPALTFLDLLNCPRNNVYQNLFETMKSKLDAQLTRLDENNLLIMLKESIQFLAIKELKSIPINIIKSLKSVPDKYLKYLAMKNFLSDLPMHVRRQAWEINNSLFITAINENCEASLLVKEVSGRIQDDGPIRLICDCIGVSDNLFHAFANHCVKKSYENNNLVWGAILRQVLMGVQEGGKKIVSLGKLSELGWLLDSFRRVGKIEDNKIISIYDTLKNLIIAQSTNEEKLFEKSIEEYHLLKGEIYLKEKQNNKINNKVTNATSEQIFSSAMSNAFTKTNKPSASKKKAVSKPKRIQKRKHHSEDEEDEENEDDALEEDEYKVEDEQNRSSRSSRNDNKRTYQDLSEEEVDHDEVKVPKIKKTKIDKPKQERKEKKVKKDFDSEDEDVDDDEEYKEDGSDTEIVSKRTLRQRNSSSNIKYDYGDNSENEEEDPELEFVRKQQLQKERKQQQRINDEQMKVNKTKEINQQYSFIKDDKLTRLLEEGLEYIKKLDVEKIFATRVTDDIAPNYSKEIRNPMDFASIKKKLDFGKYTDINLFDHDVRLVYNNCIQYNGIDSYYGNISSSYLDKWINKKKYIDLNLSTTDESKIEAFKEVNEEVYDGEEEVNEPDTEFVAALETNIACINVSNKMKQYNYFTLSNDLEPKNAIQNAIEYSWNFLSYLDIDGIFANPVTDTIAPGYSSYITTPMDLSTMRVKKDRKKYKNLKSFDTDVKLMLSNCIQWNFESNSIYRQTAFSILYDWMVQFSTIEGELMRNIPNYEVESIQQKEQSKLFKEHAQLQEVISVQEEEKESHTKPMVVAEKDILLEVKKELIVVQEINEKVKEIVKEPVLLKEVDNVVKMEEVMEVDKEKIELVVEKKIKMDEKINKSIERNEIFNSNNNDLISIPVANKFSNESSTPSLKLKFTLKKSSNGSNNDINDIEVNSELKHQKIDSVSATTTTTNNDIDSNNLVIKKDINIKQEQNVSNRSLLTKLDPFIDSKPINSTSLSIIKPSIITAIPNSSNNNKLPISNIINKPTEAPVINKPVPVKPVESSLLISSRYASKLLKLSPSHSICEITEILAETKLAWALCMLRDPLIQVLLKNFLSSRLKILHEKSKLNKINKTLTLPYEDIMVKMALQLCQLSLIVEPCLYCIDESLLRIDLPLLLLYITEEEESLPLGSTSISTAKECATNIISKMFSLVDITEYDPKMKLLHSIAVSIISKN